MLNRFISVEGIDGSGKTTLLDSIERQLSNYTKRVYRGKGFGSGIISAAMRVALFNKYKDIQKEPMELLGMPLALYECQEVFVKEHLVGEDNIVLLDRYVASHYSYQCMNEITGEISTIINSTVLGSKILHPDLYIYCEVDPGLALYRLTQRSDNNYLDSKTVKQLAALLDAYNYYFANVLPEVSSKTKVVYVDSSVSIEDVPEVANRIIKEFILGDNK